MRIDLLTAGAPGKGVRHTTDPPYEVGSFFGSVRMHIYL